MNKLKKATTIYLILLILMWVFYLLELTFILVGNVVVFYIFFSLWLISCISLLCMFFITNRILKQIKEEEECQRLKNKD